jgi:hypothetical protein
MGGRAAGESGEQCDDQQRQGERAEAVAASLWSLGAPIDDLDLDADPPRSSATLGRRWRQDGDGELAEGCAVEGHQR